MHTVSVLPVCLHTLRQSSILLTFSLSLSVTARAAVCELLPVGICLLPVCTAFFQQVQSVVFFLCVYK